ncbi:hypothetical protein Ahy_B03g064335 isoform A [Arachis hypogaea]|uniref:Legume lectin domain-containing protein n=1 Tax=Arachis hypogaea TaxID=3818 RepID=A0A444ZZD8_ARAHY|nr:hypothetical protein Ahy_B03g064335 isoform A [Arachis hypogaea]
MGSFISFLIFTLCCSSSFSLVHSFDNTASDSLNSLVQDFALRSFIKHRHRHQTGAVYDALLPRNLSGMNASVVRLRSRRLWSKGANFGYFRIPPKTASIPHVKRLAIVYQDFGNWSSRYYNLSGYSLASSVVGFMVFDASNVTDTNVRNLTLNTMVCGLPLQWNIPSYRDGLPWRVLLERAGKKRPWYLWLIGFVVGFFGLIAVVYVGVLCLRLVKAKRIQDMERQANEDLVLESRWVGNSKMPSAAVTRTQPVLESGVQ